MSGIDLATSTINAMFTSLSTFLTTLFPIIIPTVLALAVVFAVYRRVKGAGRKMA